MKKEHLETSIFSQQKKKHLELTDEQGNTQQVLRASNNKEINQAFKCNRS